MLFGKYIVGLTGGIGSGKTTVANIFATFGIQVFVADTVAADIANNNDTVRKELKNLLGNNIYDTNDRLNRSAMAEIVFSDKNLLSRVNAIIHPRVRDTFHLFVKNATSNYVIKEAAILFESGSAAECDATITVNAPQEMRIERVMKRDHRTLAEVKNIVARQMTDEERSRLADYTIINDNSQSLIEQVQQLHNIFNNQISRNGKNKN